jgi:hypothetical protein
MTEDRRARLDVARARPSSASKLSKLEAWCFFLVILPEMPQGNPCASALWISRMHNLWKQLLLYQSIGDQTFETRSSELSDAAGIRQRPADVRRPFP